MIYTVHLGPRAVEWLPKVGEKPTRGEAQALAKHLLREAPADVDKAEVRCRARLLDSYGKRPTGTIRQTCAFTQRRMDSDRITDKTAGKTEGEVDRDLVDAMEASR